MNIHKTEIKSQLSEIKSLATVFHDFSKKNGIDKDTANLMELAIVEAVNNIVIHAYAEEPDHKIYAQFEVDENQLKIILTDTGKAFEQKQQIKNTKTSLPEGNWGLDLIDSIVDQTQRYRTDKRNSFILIKQLN